MAIFRIPRFIRRYLRRSMHPMAEKEAWSMKTRISILYAIIAWHAMGFVLYQCYKGNKHWPITAGIRDEREDMARPAYQFAKALGIQKAKVVQVDSLRNVLNAKVDSFSVEKQEESQVKVPEAEEAEILA